MQTNGDDARTDQGNSMFDCNDANDEEPTQWRQGLIWVLLLAFMCTIVTAIITVRGTP